MKILSLKPFLKSAQIHPSPGEYEEASNLLTHILYLEGHEIFVLPWDDEKVWNERPFCVDEDYSYATALPTLFFPRITDLSKTIIRSFKEKSALKNPNKHVWKLIQNSFYQQKIFLRNAMNSSKADIVHSHHSDPRIIELYRKQNYKSPIILTHFSDSELNESITTYDFVIFTDKEMHTKAINKMPPLKNKSRFINYSMDEGNREDFKQSHLKLYREITDLKEIKQ